MARYKATASLTGTRGSKQPVPDPSVTYCDRSLALHDDAKATGLPNATLNVEIAYIIYNKE